MNELLKHTFDAIIEGKADLVKDTTEKAIKAGGPPLQIINEALSPGLKEVGERFAKDELFLCDLMMSADAVKEGFSLLEPIMSKLNIEQEFKGKIVIGTVEGDIHDIGKTIVKTALKAQGFEVIDLGCDILAAKFVEAVQTYKPHILGMSALLSITIPRMKKVIDLLKERNLRGKVKVVIGGAIVSDEYAKSIEADAYAADVIDGVSIIENFIAQEDL